MGVIRNTEPEGRSAVYHTVRALIVEKEITRCLECDFFRKSHMGVKVTEEHADGGFEFMDYPIPSTCSKAKRAFVDDEKPINVRAEFPDWCPLWKAAQK